MNETAPGLADHQVDDFVRAIQRVGQNAPLRYYEGTTTRPIQEEYYRWWATFGVKMNF